MAKLTNGMSEIDTVVLRLPDYGREIVNWSRYSFNQQFLSPTSGWSFSISDEDTALTNDLLVEGAVVQLVINNNVQCTGYIEKKTIQTGPRGTTVTIQGRDILGPVVDATIDPDFKFTAGMTIPQFVLAVLLPFGIKNIRNSDAANINIITGLPAKQGGGGTSTVQVPQQQSTVNADGTITLSSTYVQATVTQVSGTRPDLKTITIQQLKPHAGEGVYAFIDRVLRRLGFTMWAMADGSGVVIDKADFTTPPSQKIVHKRTDPSRNNVLDGTMRMDLTSQPSVIIATGRGGGQTTAKSAMRVIMVNELTGLDENGFVLSEIRKIADKYASAKFLDLRSELAPFKRPKGDRKVVRPFFLKDDEAKNMAQLEAFVRREMGNRQMKSLQLDYRLVGHTSDGVHPWGINTSVAVEDDVFGVQETMWVVEKEFTKSNSGGTETSLKLIRPYTLQISV